MMNTYRKGSSVAAQVTDLKVQFPGQNALLFDSCSMEICHGEKVLLLGPTGSGKSTLLKILTGLIPDAIEVPMRCRSKKVFSECGFVFQDPDSQFCMPYVDEEIAFVLENIAVPRVEMPGKIQHYLGLVGLHFDNAHQPIQELSEGQKQRLALASALALEPRSLILDEPTALLDPKGTTAIWQNIRQTAGDRTIVIVEHKIEEVLGFVDRVIVLNDEGQIIANGPAEETCSSNEHILDEYGIWHANSWVNYDSQRFEEQTSQTDVEARGGHPLMQVNRLEGLYRNEKKIELDEVTVSSAEWIAITGPNGAGKSTLLLALMQLIKTKGEVIFGGKEIHKTEELSSEVGFVFQNPELQFIKQKVQEEIAFTLRQQQLDEAEIKSRVNHTIQQFELEKVADHNPYQLSTGQQRRLSVAATAVKKRQILLLDEPTFGQDARNTFGILEYLEKLRKAGTAILMVTHDLEIVKRFATRQWHIEEGRLKIDETKTKGGSVKYRLKEIRRVR